MCCASFTLRSTVSQKLLQLTKVEPRGSERICPSSRPQKYQRQILVTETLLRRMTTKVFQEFQVTLRCQNFLWYLGLRKQHVCLKMPPHCNKTLQKQFLEALNEICFHIKSQIVGTSKFCLKKSIYDFSKTQFAAKSLSCTHLCFQAGFYGYPEKLLVVRSSLCAAGKSSTNFALRMFLNLSVGL